MVKEFNRFFEISCSHLRHASQHMILCFCLFKVKCNVIIW